jgi:hypothetical protein
VSTLTAGRAATSREQFYLDFDSEMAYSEVSTSADNVLLDVPLAAALSDYLSHVSLRGQRDALLEARRSFLAQQPATAQKQGLLPNIELPNVLPSPVSAIIGKGGELKVAGSQRITVGGVSDYTVGQVQTEWNRTSRFPNLRMKQELTVNLEGVVGEKVHVLTDYQSERPSDLKNTIRLRYQGGEDEIVQTIEAGNTDLSLPGTEFVGYSGHHKGLFGVKSQGKLGPLEFTAIASKEEGRSERTTFTGMARAETLRIYDRDFLKWRFYQLIPESLGLPPLDSLLVLRLYVDDLNLTNNSEDGALFGKAFINPADTTDSLPAWADDYHRGYFSPLTPGPEQDYIVEDNGDFNPATQLLRRAVFSLNQSVDRKVLGAFYSYRDISGNIQVVGDTTYSPASGDTTVVLQMIKPLNTDPFSRTWDYMLRNVYDLESDKIVQGSFNLVIRYQLNTAGTDPETQGSRTYLNLLGLDDYNNENLTPTPDGQVDEGRIDFTRGLVYFPSLRPFASANLAQPDTLIYQVPEDLLASHSEYSRYYLEVAYKSRQTAFYLGNLDILEGTEVVKVNGEVLSRNRDYTIDYDTGWITFLSSASEKVNNPSSILTIDYEYAPFFALAQKTLAGIRGVFNWDENKRIGSSLLMHSERTPDLRPRLGEEPQRIMVGEIDGSLKFQPAWMTTAVDRLPLVETQVPSRLNISAELAASVPNPNTLGEVYLDDMEGSKTANSLGISREYWSFGSVPVDQDTGRFGFLRWYSPREGFRAYEINPTLNDETERNEWRTALLLDYDPLVRAVDRWAGIMRCISRDGEDLSESRLLHLWVKGDHGTLKVDLASGLPEDAPRRIAGGSIRGFNGSLDTEDRNRDGRLDAGEDTGLDGVPGTDGQNVPGDDGNDDYSYSLSDPNDYSHINGTEGNGLEHGIDTEDLNGDGGLNFSNDYFEFSIGLDTIPANEFGWKEISIPLTDNSSAIGRPTWRRIVYARLWITGLDTASVITIGEAEIVGNKWLSAGLFSTDSTTPDSILESFRIDVRNNKEHADYSPPFDPGQDERGRPRAEQSLALVYGNLQANHGLRARQNLWTADTLTGYRTMSFYVHGDGFSSPEFFFRLGADTLNYYEYRLDVRPGWSEITVDLDELTHLKTLAASDTGYTVSGNYAMRGRPSLTNIRQFMLGLLNTSDVPISGEIWVDELRLKNVRKDRGTASRVRVEGQFADLLTFNANFYRKNSDFHGLLQKKGQGFTNSVYGFSGTLSLQKFFPKGWNLSLPLTATLGRDYRVPKYQVGSDVILKPEEASRERSLSQDLSLTFSYAKTTPSLHRLARLFLDPVRGSISHTRRQGDSPLGADTTRTLNGTLSYSYNPQVRPLTLPGRIKFTYFPTAISFGTSYARSATNTYSKTLGQSVPITSKFLRTGSGSTSISLRPFSSVSGSYALSVDRDLTRPGDSELARRFSLGQERQRSQNATLRYTPSLGTWVSPSFSYSTQYSENQYRQLVTLPTGPDSLSLRNVANSNSRELRATVSLSKVVGLVTRLRNEEKDSLAMVGSPGWMLMQIERISSSLLALQASYRQDRSTAFYGVRDRPPRSYQFGLSEDVGSRVLLTTLNNDNRKVGNTYGLSSGISLGVMQLRAGYQRSTNEVTSGGNTTIRRARTWPDLNLSLMSLEDLPLLKPVASSSTLSATYSTRSDESENVGSGLTSTGETKQFTPGWRVEWKKGFSTALEGSYQRSARLSLSSSSRPRTVTERKGVRVSTKYSFSAPTGMRLPFFGSRVHFNSNLDLSVDVNLDNAYSYTTQEASLDPTPQVSANTSTFSLIPTASYNFSRSVTGGLEGEFRQEHMRKEGRTRQRIGLNLWVLFTF